MMNILAHGIDMVDCDRLQQSLDQHGQRFLDRVFTPLEQDYCNRRKKSAIQSLAGRFAVKEAVLKVLGTGWTNGIAWTDIEVRNTSAGQPKVFLTGRCKEIADQLGITEIHISISHIETHAIASAIGVAPETTTR
jgi:holo-[acyl-carrier protein] synthase